MDSCGEKTHGKAEGGGPGWARQWLAGKAVAGALGRPTFACG